MNSLMYYRYRIYSSAEKIIIAAIERDRCLFALFICSVFFSGGVAVNQRQV